MKSVSPDNFFTICFFIDGFFKAKLKLSLLYFCIIGSLTACSNSPDIPGTQIRLIDNQKIESLVRHHPQATYTLVLESGARNCIQRWEKLLQQLPVEMNVYAYNRPGYCKSSRAKTARTSDNVVHELRRALQQQGLKPPYVLVGHSMGGLYMQHFARQYPTEVKGLVLVDAIYPGLLKNPEAFPWYTKLGMSIFLSNEVQEEIYLAHASSLRIDALPAIDHMPIVRMFNEPKSKIESGDAKAVDMGMFNQDEHMVAKIRAMYPSAKILVADSSHQMQETSPELVVQAIRDLMQAKGPLQ